MVGVSTVEVKYVAVVSTAGDPRSALAGEPDGPAVNAGVQLVAPTVVQVEGVQLGQQAHGEAYRKVPWSAGMTRRLARRRSTYSMP
jgi:hypothetical protein